MEEEYTEVMDSDTVNQDFDDVDLYGEIMVGDTEDEDDDCEFIFE